MIVVGPTPVGQDVVRHFLLSNVKTTGKVITLVYTETVLWKYYGLRSTSYGTVGPSVVNES